MVFTRLEMLYIALPLALLAMVIRLRRRKHYFGHPLLFYMRGKIRPVSRLARLPSFLEFLALAALLIALVNPVLLSARHLIINQGLDILMVLDLSSSMQEPIDLQGAIERRRSGVVSKETTRLDSVKEAMLQFVRKRHSDRIGLVVFSENGYVVAPVTLDLPYLSNYLQMVDSKTLASEGQTAIGEGIFTALHLAQQQTREKRSKGRLMIVLTDGENNTGRDVYAAMQKAAEAGFKLYFIGVELRKTTESLRLIAAVRALGGDFYDVRDAQQLARAYSDIDRLEKGTFLTQKQMDHLPYYYPFALAALILLSASIALKAIPYFMDMS